MDSLGNCIRGTSTVFQNSDHQHRIGLVIEVSEIHQDFRNIYIVTGNRSYN